MIWDATKMRYHLVQRITWRISKSEAGYSPFFHKVFLWPSFTAKYSHHQWSSNDTSITLSNMWKHKHIHAVIIKLTYIITEQLSVVNRSQHGKDVVLAMISSCQQATQHIAACCVWVRVPRQTPVHHTINISRWCLCCGWSVYCK